MIRTARLEVRPPQERDRDRLVALFQDPEFMVFSGGVHDTGSAHRRFDRMLETVSEVPFAKQPIIERSTGTLIGYTGVDWYELEGVRWLEYGYRLVPSARGKGFATEAGLALLGLATEYDDDLLAMIDPTNRPSQNVIAKLGFAFWKQAEIENYPTNLYRRAQVGTLSR